jgi:hypothetical protein
MIFGGGEWGKSGLMSGNVVSDLCNCLEKLPTMGVRTFSLNGTAPETVPGYGISGAARPSNSTGSDVRARHAQQIFAPRH